MASQASRKAETRRLLLEAAADLFAERGVDGASIDAIADRADRTSGAVYDHFGSKDGLLFALLDGWVDDVAAVVGAELSTLSSPSNETTIDEWLHVLWRNVSSPVVGGGRWMALEHELWAYAVRTPDARDYLARRYRAAWRGVNAAARSRSGASNDGSTPRDDDGPGIGPALIGLLFGLEMMRQIDPTAVTDELAVGALRQVVASTAEKGSAHADSHL